MRRKKRPSFEEREREVLDDILNFPLSHPPSSPATHTTTPHTRGCGRRQRYQPHQEEAGQGALVTLSGSTMFSETLDNTDKIYTLLGDVWLSRHREREREMGTCWVK